MLWRSNKGKDSSVSSTDEQTPRTENRITPEEKPLTREELLAQNEEARAMYENILKLRQSVESLKNSDTITTPVDNTGDVDVPESSKSKAVIEDEEIKAAKQAVLEQAKRDREEKKRKAAEARAKQLKVEAEQRRIAEAAKKAALIEEEAERKRREAEEADKRAKEVARKKALEIMEAEREAKERLKLKHHSATPEESAAFFGEKIEETKEPEQIPVEELESMKETLKDAQEKQGEVFNKIANITEKHTDKLAEVQKNKVEEVAQTRNEALKEREESLQAQQLRVIQEKGRIEDIERKREAQKAEKKRMEEAEKAYKRQAAAERALRKQQHKAQVRAERVAKVERKRAEKARKASEKERLKEEKKRLAREKARLEREAKEDAKKGGGVVKVKGMEINTAINKTPEVKWKDFFGLTGIKAEKEASTEAEKESIREEREQLKSQARFVASALAVHKRGKFLQSRFGKRMATIREYCERNKSKLIVTFSAVLTCIIAFAGVFSYATAYQYSYNGQVLGIVKEKDEVLQITDMVQSALTEEKNVDVVIDAKDDITFKRVLALGDTTIDSSDEVLKRLTYMGDLNVKAYGIYVDGKKVGAVADKETAANVLQRIKDKYSSDYETAEIEEAVFLESVDIKESNTSLEDLVSEDEMLDILCTSGNRETTHKVVAGETLADIAKLYSLSEEKLLEDNPNINPKKLVVGSSLVIKQNAPIVTVKITELVTYEKEIKYESEKQKSSDIYEGYTETKQKGSNGLSEITSKITTVNGEQIEEDNLVTTVKKEPVKEIILVGTKERPPTVGSGKLAWPLKTSYTKTSGFGSRWGSFHKGVDLAVSTGTSVYAADGGTVTESGYNSSYGYTILIDHGNGMTTRYAHCSKLLVNKGDKVFQGQKIALSGSTGRSTGPHLHFEVRIDNVPKNPYNYLP